MHRPYGRGRTPFPRNPNFFSNPNFNPNFLPTTFANPFGSLVPSFPPQPAPPPATPPEKLRDLVGRIEKAAEKAHGEILARGENVTSWKVSQAALRELKLESWNAIGIQIQGVPYLYKLIVKEGKVDAYIHCFVGVRRITTVHELDVAICESEGVEKFEELQLGPLLQHPLVIHYFSIPSDATEVPEITAEDIAVSLDVYMGNSKKRVATDEFLDFLKEKYSVADKEKLGVRIRSLGLYITYLRNARKTEYCALQKTHDSVKHNYGKGKNKVMECQLLNTISEQKSEHRSEDCFQKENDKYMETPDMISEKVNLDKRFDSISSRVNMFSASLNGFGNSHLRFDFPDDDIENSFDRQDKSSPQETQRVTSCPYPSTTEEIARLGLKTDRLRKRSPDSCNLKSIGGRIRTRKKMKLEKENWGSALSMIYGDCPDLKVKIKDPAFPSHLKDDIILDYAVLEDFAATWKEACKELSVLEVLNTMLSFYGTPVKKKKTKRLLAELFSSNPGIGLLNVAVTSIKLGLLDSLCDISFSTSKDELSTDYVLSAEAKIDTSARESETCNACVTVTVDDIVEKVVTYFNSSCMLQLSKQSNSNLALLNFFRDCELWVATQFSVIQFNSLGYGDFLAFLEKNSILLPGELCKFLMGNESRESLLVVSMIQSQLQVFLSQIANGCSEKDLSRGDVSLLLGKQFPTISLKAMENVSQDSSLDVIRMKVDNVGSCSVLFSSTLLGKPYTKTSSAYSRSHLSSVSTLTAEDDKGSLVQQVSHEDAIKCLTKAPLLSDLYSWSHWDLLYEPSLGSLLEWLLTTPRCKELLCIVTRDGKFIRIDHSASPDQFLEAAIQGSPFLAAVKLISVIPLYGGMCNAPLSLLKHFAQRAIDVMIKNTIANVEVEANRRGLKRVSSFILDCLTHLPPEFRSFGAEILVPGLQAVSKDAYTVILSECKQIHQRLMLHDIGLSLGIVHWIEDYNAFKSLGDSISLMPLQVVAEVNRSPEIDVDPKHSLNASQRVFSTHRPKAVQSEFEICLIDMQQKALNDSEKTKELPDANKVNVRDDNLIMLEDGVTKEANLMIETIRREEFGLDPNQECSESSLLKKQHARLGRALQCLSQELYSQDSHLLLELIQNADDNVYPDSAEPSLIFILQDSGIVILNNEQGFTVENIRALCDVGNSTKKGGVGYIGRKGIGFKSVFRVTDAPEIHSNGFHVKFDISEGQIGFVLPTVVSPCDINNYTRQLPCEVHLGASWNTCIVLPFRSNLKDDAGINSVISLFSDLHPSLLLFLHRLNCIAFKNMFNDDFIVMRKENMGDGIVRISHGNEKVSWLVVHNKLQTNLIRSDVQITEIAIAFTLEELDSGGYRPHLSQQPVFAFLPLRQYGLKFILQGDFVLPSSREEVDGDSAWNQWLLSEFPSLFVTAEKSFCNLPCFKSHPGKAVSTFMSYVPLVGEVYGFFSHLPNMILSKLRISNCLILEDHDMEWVPPCRVLRGWDEQARILILDSMLEKHLGLGYLKKDIFMSDSLARALGIQNYGPKTLVDIISSICDTDHGGIECMGFGWLSSWLIAFSSFLHVQSTGDDLIQGIGFDLINCLKKIPFVPLSDGSYGSVSDGPIWLSCESFNFGFDGKNDPQSFPHLHRQIRTVNPLLLSAEMSHVFNSEEKKVDTLKKILNMIGVRELSDHEIIKTYVLHGLAGGIQKSDDENLLIEYLSFVMLHFQSDCRSCSLEKEGLISELRKKSIFLTNHGCKSPMMEPIHFGKEFKNPIKLDVLIENDDPYWHEIDSRYLKHPGTQTLAYSITKWRQFFLSMGVTDFVQVVQVQKNASDTSTHYSASMTSNVGQSGSGLIVDWESPELLHLLSTFSSKNCLEKCKYLLEVLDNQWDDYYGAKVSGYLILNSDSDKKPIESSFLKSIRGTKWIVTSIDKELRFPKDVYFECEAVCSIIGAFAPYAVSQVSSKRLLKDIGFKTQVTLDDALTVLQQWALSCSPFSASISQMSNFYFFIWDNVSLSREKIWDSVESIGWIFVPFIGKMRCKGTIPGQLLTHKDVYWQDPTGCVDQIKDIISSHSLVNDIFDVPCRTLAAIYPNLHAFFVKECRVAAVPSYLDYVAILFQLSRVSLPSKAAPAVFRVLLKWANDLKTGIMKSEEMVELKNSLSKLENTVLPTMHDRWVSLHPKCGVICWCDDEELRSEFKCFDEVCFLQFGELNNEEKEMLNGKIAVLLQRIGVPALSKVVSREASFNGADSNQEKVLLINWILPYAQRYIHKLCRDTYLHVKELVLEKLQRLQVSVVQNLFYRHTLMGQSSTLKKRHKCNSLLQGDILYTTRNSDSHSLFLEFSRIFFNGSRNLHLTNFLHMVTTMAESGSSKEQIEFFILNSQEVPKLPVGEPLWPTLSVHSGHEDKNSSKNLKAVSNEENITRLPANAGTSANWPPTDWKNAPGVTGLTQQFRLRAEFASHGIPFSDSTKPFGDISSMENTPYVGDLIAIDTAAATTLVLQEPGDNSNHCCLQDCGDSVDIQNISNMEVQLGLDDSHTQYLLAESSNSAHHINDNLSAQAPNEEEAYKTGRLGEAAAYGYFSKKLNPMVVRWANKDAETGLPYDLVIGEGEAAEYIEVKTTKSRTKNWFPITAREWQFASEKGAAFSIARVVILGPSNAQIIVLRNPVELCQKNMLNLAILMS